VPTKEAHPSRERDETEQAKALRIVQEELKRRGWTRAELKRRRKGDEAKVALARRLREETAVSLRWIAENLYMGTGASWKRCHCFSPTKNATTYAATVPQLFHLLGSKDCRFNPA
jgi:hypothetical protein